MKLRENHRRAWVAVLGVLGLLRGCGYDQHLDVEDLIPPEDSMSYWTLDGTPAVVSDEQGLYLQIDGAADKYIERGWVECVFLHYSHESTSMTVGIHDMGEDANAVAILEYDTPVSHTVLWDSGDSTALLDTGLPSVFAIKMSLKRFYAELGIEGKDQLSEQRITECATLIRNQK